MARVEIIKCDGCGERMDPERSDRIIKLTVWGTLRPARVIDLCRDCFRKMCEAVKLDPNDLPSE